MSVLKRLIPGWGSKQEKGGGIPSEDVEKVEQAMVEFSKFTVFPQQWCQYCVVWGVQNLGYDAIMGRVRKSDGSWESGCFWNKHRPSGTIVDLTAKHYRPDAPNIIPPDSPHYARYSESKNLRKRVALDEHGFMHFL